MQNSILHYAAYWQPPASLAFLLARLGGIMVMRCVMSMRKHTKFNRVAPPYSPFPVLWTMSPTHPQLLHPTMEIITYSFLLYKVVQCFIRTSGTDRTDNLTCETIYDNFTCENYRFSNNHVTLKLCKPSIINLYLDRILYLSKARLFSHNVMPSFAPEL